MTLYKPQNYYKNFFHLYSRTLFNRATGAVLVFMAFILLLFSGLIAIKYQFPPLEKYQSLLLSESIFKWLIIGFTILLLLLPILLIFRALLILSLSTELGDNYLEHNRLTGFKAFNFNKKIRYSDILHVFVYTNDMLVIDYKDSSKQLPQAINLYFPKNADKYSFLTNLNKKVPNLDSKLALRSFWIERPKLINLEYLNQK